MSGTIAASGQRILLPGGAPANPGQFAVTNGLVGYWPLGFGYVDLTNNLSLDISGFGSNGSNANISASTLVEGQVGGSINFGSTSQVTITGVPAPLVGLTTNVGLSCWAKGTTVNTVFFAVGTGNSPFNGYGLGVSSGGFWRCNIPGAGECVSSISATNQWTHVVLTQNPVSGWVMYINGKYALLANPSRVASAPTVGVTIGNAFVGNIGDCRAYNRALDNTDALQLYLVGLNGRRDAGIFLSQMDELPALKAAAAVGAKKVPRHLFQNRAA